MRARLPEQSQLSREDIHRIEAYAEHLIRYGMVSPQLDPNAEVVDVTLTKLPTNGSVVKVHDVHVHYSNGKPWQTSLTEPIAKPLEKLHEGLFAINRLRGDSHTATLDVMYAR